MDQNQENPFLNNNQNWLAAYDEDQEDFSMDKVVEQASKTDEKVYEQQIYDTFVREKSTILSTMVDLVKYAANLHDIPLDKLFISETQKKMQDFFKSRIKSEKDLFNLKNRLTILFLRYQEQSSVLDPILADIIEPMMRLLQIYVKKACANNQYEVPREMAFIFEVIYNLGTVRGHKKIVKFFPHEAADLEPCVELLHFQASGEYWISCVLTLWLSIIVLVPFDLQTIDSTKEGSSHEKLVKRMINITKEAVQNSGKIRDFAAILLSKLLTRPDVIKSGETETFIKELVQIYLASKEDSQKMFTVSGIMQTLVEVFKIGHRDDFLSKIDLLFEPILQNPVENKFMKKSLIIRKYRVKLAQRIGCIFLKPRVASWRYQRGQRNLAHLLSEEAKAKQAQQQEEDEEMLDEEEIDFEQLEFIIQLLFESLKDDDGVVRWSAAKGLGRITQRLTKDFADQIVEQLFDLFSESETESSWHGGCLALAELCRRGLLLPERLDTYVPILDKALVYDVNKGNHSVGSHVRDAACYVVWSFARAYAPDIMKPHVATLSTKLIVASLFDREVNCRRAASATFQECVGRQGTFPHGIEILTEADYFTLSNRVNAYLNVSCFVGQFTEYFESMVTHLAFTKLVHHEPSMRILASQALSVLSIFNPELIIEKVLLPLTEKCYSKALHVRHGAILGVGEILIGLSGNSIVNRKEVLEKAFRTLSLRERKMIQDSQNAEKFKEKYEALSSTNFLPEHLPTDSNNMGLVVDIVGKIHHEKLSKGKGGELIRAGICHLIHAISISQIKLSEDQQNHFFNTLQENFQHPNPEIQDEAAKAFGSFCSNYFNENHAALGISEITPEQPIMKNLRGMFKPSSDDVNIAVTRGFNMAFGVLSKKMIEVLQPELLQVVLANVVPKGRESDDAEQRKQSIKSAALIINTMGFDSIPVEVHCQAIEQFYKGYDDYAIDRRGDVGSWVREESMSSLRSYIHTLMSTQNQALITGVGANKPEFFERFISMNLQQLNEKIDRVREVAGRSLQQFFKFTLPLVEIEFSMRNELLCLFISEEHEADKTDTLVHDHGIAYLPWRNAQFVFQSIKPFFDSPAYSEQILKGLIVSSGGLTESTLKASQNSLFEYLSEASKIKDQDGNIDMDAGIAKKKEFIGKLCHIFEKNQKVDRVTVPLMITIEMLLEADYLSDEEIQSNIHEIHRLTVAECNKSKNMSKLISGVGVFAGMLSSSEADLQRKAIKTLLFLLYHNFPKVRKMAAEKIYTGLLTLDEYDSLVPGGEDDFEKINDLLSETDWAGIEAKVLTAQSKAEMYQLFGHEWKPAAKK